MTAYDSIEPSYEPALACTSGMALLGPICPVPWAALRKRHTEIGCSAVKPARIHTESGSKPETVLSGGCSRNRC
jgi:hypothetical protein